MPTSIDPLPDFLGRHVGPSEEDIREMLEGLGLESLGELMEETIPASIGLGRPLDLPDAVPESVLLERLRALADLNRLHRSFIGLGYHSTVTPPVIQRNVLENPGWYTQYTPYQAEISQGRLEALLVFQTLTIDLTGLEIANASLLDESTAAAEAMSMFYREASDESRNVFFVSQDCHPQTIGVVRTRAEPVGIEVVVGDHRTFKPDHRVFGTLLQYPASDGGVHDYRDFTEAVHVAGGSVVVAADLLALTLLTPPGEWGADAVVGNSQRFGVPMGFGGPHAAFMTADGRFRRTMPGRIIGVSVDAHGNRALRMALQTREQHIRRERATSNICTAQVLLAVVAAMYAVYHGPEGLRRIGERIHRLACVLARGLERLGHGIVHDHFFDTIRVRISGGDQEALRHAALVDRIDLRYFDDGSVGVALDEPTTTAELDRLFTMFNGGVAADFTAAGLAAATEPPTFPDGVARTSSYLEHPVFHSYRSETEMLRYLSRLEARDLSLDFSMIPLGSCTMKLNPTTAMTPITWPEFGGAHPFTPVDRVRGYRRIIEDLEAWLGEITGLDAVSLQPNSGAQGEYTGLLTIRAYHLDHGGSDRRICLIPSSAHGTNPASAVMAGFEVRVVRVDGAGAIDLDDLRAKAAEHADRLGAIMVTYPSTAGVFEEEIEEICRIVHEHGGLVYLDGANLNAQVGLARPGDYGADVCHVNLHKTFAIPHGGGGPGMGPVCANERLAPYLPGHPLADVGGERAIGPVASAPWGSASILIISWAYMAMLGKDGLRRASEVAVLSANYMARRLEEHYSVLYRGARGRVAHEFILDLRPLRKASGITEEDIAKRLIDYGFHAPTMSWPVPGTVMVEPTESESRAELDRFCDALISIRAEVQQIELGLSDPRDNALKNAPHTAWSVASDDWARGYSREQAAFPAPWTRGHKFWPWVGRVDNAWGDRNLVCACPPMEEYGSISDETGRTVPTKT
jgi:glycine dehydrogenase